jgi:hypothetical protein
METDIIFQHHTPRNLPKVLAPRKKRFVQRIIEIDQPANEKQGRGAHYFGMAEG